MCYVLSFVSVGRLCACSLGSVWVCMCLVILFHLLGGVFHVCMICWHLAVGVMVMVPCGLNRLVGCVYLFVGLLSMIGLW